MFTCLEKITSLSTVCTCFQPSQLQFIDGGGRTQNNICKLFNYTKFQTKSNIVRNNIGIMNLLAAGTNQTNKRDISNATLDAYRTAAEQGVLIG